MDTVVDIVNAALDRDSVGMKHALEVDLASRVANVLDDIRHDVAAGLFGVSQNSQESELEGTE